MSFKALQYEIKGAVGIVTMNQPEKLNAISGVMVTELRKFFLDRCTDKEVRAIVITGAGRGFCSGVDMKDEITNQENWQPAEVGYSSQRRFSDVISFMRRCPQPIIAAVNGVAAGAGLSISAASDIRIVSESAKFIASFINIGLGGAEMGTSWFMPRLVGLGNAALYLMTGMPLEAAEAHRIGFAQAVVPLDELMDKAIAIAEVLTQKSPLGLRLTKEALERSLGGLTVEDTLRIEDRNQVMCVSQLSSPLKKAE